MRRFRVSARPALAIPIAAMALANCASTDLTPTAAGPVPPSIEAEQVVGRWGLGSYHLDQDRERTVKQAGSQCGQAYTINSGPTGGVVMHLADERDAQELRMKGMAGGRTFVGPDGPAGDPRDREIVSYDGRTMIMTWVDPEVAKRYGTMVFVRCGTPPARRA